VKSCETVHGQLSKIYLEEAVIYLDIGTYSSILSICLLLNRFGRISKPTEIMTVDTKDDKNRIEERRSSR
jgi:hypothetical protein